MIIIGHRGAAGHCPENTISAIKKGIRIGVDYIEIDVQPTKDNIIVVFHDKTLTRLTNYSGYLSDYTYAELKKVKVMKTEYIPTLDEVCNLIKENKQKIFIEIKVPGIENDVINIANRYLDYDSFIIGSFFHKSIKKVNELNNQIKTLAIFSGVPLDIRNLIDNLDCEFIGLSASNYDKEMIDILQKMNKKVFIYTVNEPIEIEYFLNQNIDGIISNYPDRIIKIKGK